MEQKDTIYYELENQFKEKSKMRYDHVLLWIAVIIFIILLSFFVVFRPHEYVDDIDNLPEPLQEDTSWWMILYVNWERLFVDFLAEYDIQWRVLAKKAYSDVIGTNKIVNKLWPRDFVLWWWVLGREENIDKFNRYEYWDRYVQPGISSENYDWFKGEFSGMRWEAQLYFSNNHPISDSRKIRKLLKKVKVWDVIRIKWYLIYMLSEKWWYWWPSSMVRDDHWCEIIYVTDISWLREK